MSGDLTQTSSYSFSLLFFFSLGNRFLDEGKRRNGILKFTRILCCKKLSVVKHNLVIHKKGGNRKRREVAWCRDAPAGWSHMDVSN